LSALTAVATGRSETKNVRSAEQSNYGRKLFLWDWFKGEKGDTGPPGAKGDTGSPGVDGTYK